MYKATEVVTARPASTSLLTIDSEDRFRDYSEERSGSTFAGAGSTNHSPYNFTINKPESIMNGFITRLAVTEVVFPWTIPNVNLYTDAIQVNSYNASGLLLKTSTVLIDVGFYTPKELATAFQTAVRGADTNLATFAINYTDTCQFFYTVTGGNTVAFFPLNIQAVTGKQYPSTAKQLFDLLGFDDDAKTRSAAGAGNTTLCQYTRYVDIVCPQLTYNQPLKDTSSQKVVRDSLCRLYLDQITGAFNQNIAKATADAFTPTGSRPFMIYHNFTHPKQINWLPNQSVPGYLNFQIYDDAGDLLDTAITDFGNLTNWSMSLLVTEN